MVVDLIPGIAARLIGFIFYKLRKMPNVLEGYE
jgi:hypothetical protein